VRITRHLTHRLHKYFLQLSKPLPLSQVNEPSCNYTMDSLQAARNPLQPINKTNMHHNSSLNTTLSQLHPPPILTTYCSIITSPSSSLITEPEGSVSPIKSSPALEQFRPQPQLTTLSLTSTLLLPLRLPLQDISSPKFCMLYFSIAFRATFPVHRTPPTFQ
jgi:hypothetical protein